MPLAHICCVRCNVQNEDELLDTANLLTNVHWVTHGTGLFQSAVWHTLHEEQLFAFMYILYKGCNQGTVIFASSFVICFNTNL
jgi:hypothetical protein